MTTAIAFLLAATFLISVGGLALLVWALANDQFTMGERAARTIFGPDEIGQIEDPATPSSDLAEMQLERGELDETTERQRAVFEARAQADKSTQTPVLWWLVSSLVWLVFGSVFGVIASIKLHLPDWLVADAALTFGRLRPAHLNIVAYGWASMAGVGVGLWMIPRLFRTQLVGGHYAVAGAAIWNIGVAVGTVALLLGLSDGMEWLEFPWPVDIATLACMAFTHS